MYLINQFDYKVIKSNQNICSQQLLKPLISKEKSGQQDLNLRPHGSQTSLKTIDFKGFFRPSNQKVIKFVIKVIKSIINTRYFFHETLFTCDTILFFSFKELVSNV